MRDACRNLNIFREAKYLPPQRIGARQHDPTFHAPARWL